MKSLFSFLFAFSAASICCGSFFTLNNGVNTTLNTMVEKFPVSTTENDLAKSITLSPNPTKGLVHLYSKDSNFSVLNIRDAMGQIVSQSRNLIAGKSKSIDLSSMQSGLYFVTIKIGHQEVMKHIVKQ